MPSHKTPGPAYCCFRWRCSGLIRDIYPSSLPQATVLTATEIGNGLKIRSVFSKSSVIIIYWPPYILLCENAVYNNGQQRLLGVMKYGSESPLYPFYGVLIHHEEYPVVKTFYVRKGKAVACKVKLKSGCAVNEGPVWYIMQKARKQRWTNCHRQRTLHSLVVFSYYLTRAFHCGVQDIHSKYLFINIVYVEVGQRISAALILRWFQIQPSVNKESILSHVSSTRLFWPPGMDGYTNHELNWTTCTGRIVMSVLRPTTHQPSQTHEMCWALSNYACSYSMSSFMLCSMVLTSMLLFLVRPLRIRSSCS